MPGHPRMLDVVRSAFRSARRLSVAVSFFRYSGFGLVADDLREFLHRGGELRLLVSTYLGVTQPEALEAVLEFPGVQSRLFLAHRAGESTVGFHPKLYLIDDEPGECWVGSSNFTKGGLATNIEANLRHEGGPEVASVRSLFDRLWAHENVRPLTREIIGDYARSIPKQGVLGPASMVVDQPEPGAWDGMHLGPNRAQSEALVRLQELRRNGERRAAVVAAPGVGKTYLAAFDAKASNARSLLFLSNRLEHLTQAQRSFRAVFGDDRTYGFALDGRAGVDAQFVFGTVRSAGGSDALLARRFDYVVVDEFHHAAAPSYRQVLEAIEPEFLLGLTATPERQDGHDVLQLCDYNIAYEVRLVDAINRRWLLPFHYFGVADDHVDYRAIPWRSGAFDPEALENALMVDARVDEMLRHCRLRGFDGPKRVAVGFCAGVRHAHYMADALRRRGIEALAVTGEDAVADRESIYARLQDPADALEWIFVADVLNEGVDLPAINSIVFLRPTQSATIFIQQLGRGLRLTPHTEVLTVLDFVGHHRTAWLALHALNDPGAPRGPRSLPELEFTPPEGCEVVLDARTRKILEQIRTVAPSRADLCLRAYRRLKEELAIPRPRLVHLLSDPDLPTPGDVRTAFDSWVGLRVAAGDAEPWEKAIAEGGAECELLVAAERDWQAQRVYPYAALWGMCSRPDDPGQGYEQFFERFPRWHVEYKPFAETRVGETLVRKLGELFDGERLIPNSVRRIPPALLLEEIEGRLQYILEKDYRLRHGGVLRRPSDLVLHRAYGRPEIVNHFGKQYDPARHNMGVLDFDDGTRHLVIITKLDTRGAIARHQYPNVLLDAGRFSWTSQNRQSPSTGTGRDLVEHRSNGLSIHLFVQPRSHAKAVYLGLVDVQEVEGSEPMRVTFDLRDRVPDPVIAMLRGLAA